MQCTFLASVALLKAAAAGALAAAAGVGTVMGAGMIGAALGLTGTAFKRNLVASLAGNAVGEGLSFGAKHFGRAIGDRVSGGWNRVTHMFRGVDVNGRVRGSKTLLIGEGNFSYARSLVKNDMIDPQDLVATAYERDMLADAAENIAYLQSRGVSVLHGVDARQLHNMPELGQFDNIQWNFPHSGSNRIDVNQRLLDDFFASTSPRLTPEGTVTVTLKNGKPYSSWGIQNQAENQGFRLIEQSPFEQIQGYTHRQTTRPISVELPLGATTYIFGR